MYIGPHHWRRDCQRNEAKETATTTDIFRRATFHMQTAMN